MNHKTFTKWILMTILLLSVMLPQAASAETQQGSGLAMPQLTETDCAWDRDGNLVLEEAHDLNGEPALNSRGFHKAEYTWDEQGNLLTEVYTGLNGEPVNADTGYARAEFTYENGHLVAEDRYATDGSRADIPGSYSYRRTYGKMA